MKSRLISVEKHDFLIINIEDGNFNSEDALKNYTYHITDIEPCFMKFKKVAFIHPYKLHGLNFSIGNSKFFLSKEYELH